MLKERIHVNEILDDFSLKGDPLDKTLDGLSVINTFLGNTSITFKAVKKELVKGYKTPLKIIDLGCGGGDNLRRIAKWCYDNNHKVELKGIDGNAHILDYARRKNNAFNIAYEQADILDKSFELEPCDILISSHFIYHFTDNDLCDFLSKAKKNVTKKIVFSELSRSPLAYVLFKYLGWLMPFNQIVKKDGLKAIQRSFKRKELHDICTKSKIITYSIQWKWAFRYLISINT